MCTAILHPFCQAQFKLELLELKLNKKGSQRRIRRVHILNVTR